MDARFAGLACAAALACGAQAQEPPVLRIAASHTWAMPFGRLQGEELVEGINHDVSVAVARLAGLRPQFIVVPQTRGDDAASDHSVDLRCHLSPVWTQRPAAYHWSQPLFDVSEVLVGHPGVPAVERIDALRAGQLIGTVRGFFYPTLEPQFASGRLKREDALDMAGALRKLALRRSDYAVTSVQSLAWHRKQQSPDGIAAWQLVVQKAAYHCVVPKTSALNPARLIAAANALRGSAELATILARYAEPKASEPAMR